MSNNTDLAILVSSCDRLQDTWPSFFELFWRYWPDCPYPVYLITNYLRCNDPRVTSIQVGKDKYWASNCRIALSKIPSPLVLYMQEDYFLKRKVDTDRVKWLISYMEKIGAGCMRLYPCPGPDTSIPNVDEVGLISKGAPYRVSLQAAVWRKEVLNTLIVEGETGWDMELKGSRRSDKFDMPFASVTLDPATGRNTNPPISYLSQVIVKGKWMPKTIKFCKKEGVEINLSARPVHTLWEEIWEKSIINKAYIRFRCLLAKQLQKFILLHKKTKRFISFPWQRIRRLTPFSRVFGYDRGPQSIARYYIDKFMTKHSKDIRGRVLEIGDRRYTTSLGDNRVIKSDVLHILEGNEDATIVTDLCHADKLPSDTYDCIIQTQVLQFIYDFHSALWHTKRILKPGGVLLVTLSGISQISRYDMDRWGEYWRFTTLSAQRLFEEFFPHTHLTIEAYGNVLSGISLLHGLASCELRRHELDYRDPDYEIIIGVRAIKPTRE